MWVWVYKSQKRRDFDPYFEQNRLNLLHNFMPSFLPFSFSLSKLGGKAI